MTWPIMGFSLGLVMGLQLHPPEVRELIRPLPRALEPQRPGRQADLEVNEQTEVLLDGKRCWLQDVPASAEIVELDVAEDGRTVRRIHFRSRKP